MWKLIAGINKKYVPPQTEEHDRTINLLHLTLITTGCIMGAGVYMASGLMIQEQAGPSTVLSFIVGGIIAILFGLAYAEIGTRMQCSGSFYVFGSAVSGELVGFHVGIQIFLCYLFGAAVTAKSISFYIDSLCGNAISHYFSSISLPNSHYFEETVNPFPFVLVLLFAVTFIFKAENSTKLMNVLVVVNIAVVLSVIIGGSQFANTKNWTLPPSNGSSKGKGGFMPYGTSGILTASLGAFFSLSGVEIIALIGGDVINPIKTIPLSTVLSIFIGCTAYISTTVVISLMVPYYEIDTKAPFSNAFFRHNNLALSYAISLGCVCGLTSSLYGLLFSGSRLLYSMIVDGLFTSLLQNRDHQIMKRNSGLMLCLMSAVLSVFIRIEIILELTEIFILFPTIMLNIMIINVRYSKVDPVNPDNHSQITDRQLMLSRIMTATYTTLSVGISLIIKFLVPSKPYYSLLGILGGFFIASLVAQWKLPQLIDPRVYMTPLMPFLPVISNLMVFIIMAYLDLETWILFVAISAIAIIIYLISVAVSTWRKVKEKKEPEEFQL